MSGGERVQHGGVGQRDRQQRATGRRRPRLWRLKWPLDHGSVTSKHQHEEEDLGKLTRGFSTLLDVCAGLAMAAPLVQPLDTSCGHSKAAPVLKSGVRRQKVLNHIGGFNRCRNRQRLEFKGGLGFWTLGWRLRPSTHHFIGGLISSHSRWCLLLVLSWSRLQLVKIQDQIERGKFAPSEP
jgi:hypothetical protein